MKDVKVSIITPLFNCSPYIEDTVMSVISQGYSDWEMIMVDDCSEDDSLEVAMRYSLLDSRVKVISLDRNCGAAVARNKAIEAATGRFIAFLDSDDQWLPNKLEVQLEYMIKNDVAFSFSAYEKVDSHNRGLVGTVEVPSKVDYNDLLKVCSIGCLTAMYDVDKLGKVYMPIIRKRQDLGLWLKILKKERYAFGNPEVLGRYRLASYSISANKFSAARYSWKLYRDVEQLGFFRAIYYFSFYAVNGVLRSGFPRFF